MIYNSIQVSRVQYYISTPVNVQHAHHQKSQFPPTTIQLTPFTYFTPTSSLLITILFSVSTVCFSLFWFLHIYLFIFFSQLILLSIILSRPIHLVANSNISSFYGWVVFHCIYTTHWSSILKVSLFFIPITWQV